MKYIATLNIKVTVEREASSVEEAEREVNETPLPELSFDIVSWKLESIQPQRLS